MNAGPGLAAAIGVVATALIAVAAPLWTYAISLALFGLPHVVMEFRYVDERFGARITRRTLPCLGLGLLGVVCLRLAGLAGVGTGGGRAALELLLGAGLAAAVVPALARRGAAFAMLGGALVLLAIIAAVRAPAPALIGFALLHNLTPVGFLAERLRGGERTRSLLACMIVFLVIPVLIVAGLAASALEWSGLQATDSGPANVGALDQHLGAFVPAPLLGGDHALDLFRAAAFLQCMHYAVVLHVLPKLGGGSERGGTCFRWPSQHKLLAVTFVVTTALSVGFWASFADARASYGVFAAVHAWVEVPVLLLACAAAPLGEWTPTRAA